MKKIFLVSFMLLGQTTHVYSDEPITPEEPVRVINKANGFQSQIANDPNFVQVMQILRACNRYPYQTIPPVTLKNLDNLQLLDPSSGKEYAPDWKALDPKKISSQFPISNFNVYIQTTKVNASIFPFRAKTYEQELTIDFVRYQDIVLKQYEHYIPSLVGFGFRAKFNVNTKNYELDASNIAGISSLGTLKASRNSEILSLNVQELGVTSPSLINQLNQINSANTIDEKLRALSNYQAQIQSAISNPDDATIIKPVVFSQKTQCSKS